MTTWTRELNKTLKITWPLTVGLFSQQLLALIDSMMVGHHSTVELAAASFVNTLCGAPLVVIYGFTTQIGVLVSQDRGQSFVNKTANQAGKILRHGLLWNLLIASILVTILELLNSHLDFFGQPAEVVAHAHVFLRFMALSMLPMALFNAFRQYSDGLQMTLPPMVISMTAVALNTFLNWLLIYGNWGAPELGLAGAGLATLIARTTMLLLIFLLVTRGRRYRNYIGEFFSRTLDFKLFRQGFIIGAPSAFQYVFESGIFYFVVIMMGWMGTVTLAANHTVLSLITLLYMLPFSISIATTVRVGDAVGRRDHRLARTIGYGSLYLSLIITSFCAVTMVLGRQFFARLFTPDPEVIRIACSLFVIASFFQIFDGMQAVLVGTLRGMSDVKIPTIFMFVSYWIIGGTLAYTFGFVAHIWIFTGYIGIWTGLALAVVITGLGLAYRFDQISRKNVAFQSIE